MPNIASSESVSVGEGDELPTNSADHRGATYAKETTPPSIKPTPVDQGTPFEINLVCQERKSKGRGDGDRPLP
jgi:hypothetical protein